MRSLRSPVLRIFCFQLRPAGCAGLLQEVVDMKLDGALGDEELLLKLTCSAGAFRVYLYWVFVTMTCIKCDQRRHVYHGKNVKPK